ncbi:hypothetical protein SAMN05216533_4923 [Streptomyces sp. Ag109_O5-10]|nr:hypothetical protein SAMN05216533_4923 [Streptomyces sp. Ag109_O5-10]
MASKSLVRPGSGAKPSQEATRCGSVWSLHGRRYAAGRAAQRAQPGGQLVPQCVQFRCGVARAERGHLLARLALLHAEHDCSVGDRVGQVADRGQCGHGEGRIRGRLVLRTGDAPGGPVALVSGVQQAAQFLVVSGLAEDGVGLVHEDRARVLADDAEEHRRGHVHRHDRLVDGLVEHVQHPGLAAALRRADDRQTRRVLQRGLDVRGRHPQGDRCQRLVTGQYDVLADRRPQLIQQFRTLIGTPFSRVCRSPRRPGAGPVIRSPYVDGIGPLLLGGSRHGVVSPQRLAGTVITVPVAIPWCNCSLLGTGPHFDVADLWICAGCRYGHRGVRGPSSGDVAGTVPNSGISRRLGTVPVCFHIRRVLDGPRRRGPCVRLSPAAPGDALAGDRGSGPAGRGGVRGAGGRRVLHRRSSLVRGRTGKVPPLTSSFVQVWAISWEVFGPRRWCAGGRFVVRARCGVRP